MSALTTRDRFDWVTALLTRWSAWRFGSSKYGRSLDVPGQASFLARITPASTSSSSYDPRVDNAMIDVDRAVCRLQDEDWELFVAVRMQYMRWDLRHPRERAEECGVSEATFYARLRLAKAFIADALRAHEGCQ